MPDPTETEIAEVVGVYEIDDADARERDARRIGTVRIYEDGRLEVEDAVSGQEPFLRSVVDRMNGKDEVILPSPDPAEVEFETETIAIARQSVGFASAQRAYLRKNYGLHLE
jgi:hypothetical protein